MSKQTDEPRPREYWEEYERRKAKIQNIGLSSAQYEREIEKIVTELDAEYDES
jgi:hypothetical protein